MAEQRKITIYILLESQPVYLQKIFLKNASMDLLLLRGVV